MTRQTTIDTDKIIRAAREVFLRLGINGKTSEVAKRAGISEGSIFVRFKSKNELFRAAMRAELVPGWLDALAVEAAELPGVLCAVGQAGIDHFRTVLPLTMMTWSNPTVAPRPPWPDGAQAGRDRRLITEFIKRQQAAGRVRPCDADAVAQAFLAGCAFYVLEESFAARKRRTRAEDAAYLDAFVNALWRGLAP